MKARLLIGSFLLAASTTLFAQAPGQPGQPNDGQRGMRPCAQESDPAKCEARRKEMREKRRQNFESAREACKGKGGPEHEKCVAQQMCANTPDPARCLERAKEFRDQHRQMRDQNTPKA